MKFSYNWIGELVEGLHTDAPELARLITMRTAECEGVEEAGPDHVIEVDNKSLTHRPDLWGHHGLAREVAAIVHLPLRDPADVSLLPSGESAVRVQVSDVILCPRYSALVFDNVTVRPSPPWLRGRLEAIGLNPINNIVDVTNYVMAEIAQPMHAFDAERLRGDAIYVRPALSGESIVALNDERYELGPSNLAIADEAGPIAIAGVIGGRDSAIHEGTRRIVLESANFLASSVRKTSVQLKLRTDASMRFEKSQDATNTVRGLARAIALLNEVSPGIRIHGGLADAGGPPAASPPIELPLPWLRAKLGRFIASEEVRQILEALGFGVSELGRDVFSVSVPSWRATKDISIKDDLVEEAGRIVGYDSITPAAPSIACSVPPEDPRRLYHRKLRAMAAAQGFTEVYNYSFVNEELVKPLGLDPSSHIRVLNPIAAGQELLRTSLLPRVVRNIHENSRHLAAFRLFEIGRDIHRPVEPGSLPEEIPHLAAAIFAKDDGAAGLFELKRLAECLLPACETEATEARVYEHPRRAAAILWRGEAVGRLFELHPSLGLEGRAAILDLDLALTQRFDERVAKYQPLRRFPTSAFDLSVVAPPRTPAGKVEKELAEFAGGDLLSIEYLRQFPLPEGVSLSYRLTVGSSQRTLSSDEAAAIRSRIIDGMRARGYELRV